MLSQTSYPIACLVDILTWMSKRISKSTQLVNNYKYLVQKVESLLPDSITKSLKCSLVHLPEFIQTSHLCYTAVTQRKARRSPKCQVVEPTPASLSAPLLLCPSTILHTLEACSQNHYHRTGEQRPIISL